MFRVIKHEMPRFFKVWIICMLLYIFNVLLKVKFTSELIVVLENVQITAFITGINIYILINIISDNFTNKRLLYFQSNISTLKILMGKLAVSLIYSFLSMLICILLYNFRLYLLYKNDYLTFFRMNLDGVGFALIGKSLREFFYPINFILNVLFDSILFYAMFIFFHHLKKKYNVYLSLIISIFSFLIINVIIFKIIYKINSWSSTLDFNIVKQRIHLMTLNEYEINFLSLLYVIVYGFIVIYLLIKISDYQKENRL